MSSCNAKCQVPSDCDTYKHYIPKESLLTQTCLGKINDWTKKQAIMLNKKKTNYGF